MKTRKPTGNPAWPLILVEGEEKAGKSFAAAQLSASPLVGRTFVWDLGDGTMDEYASLGPYEIVETNGTYTDLRASVEEAVAIPAQDGKPNVYVIDSGTDLWDLLKRWTDGRARNSRNGRKALAEDPDAEIDPSANLWNDAKDRWASIVNLLLRAPGIGVVTAQGTEVMAFENGVPVANKTTWSVQAEKTIPRTATAWVRVKRDPRSATLIGVRRLGLEIPVGGLALPIDNTLHALVFDVIGAGAQFATPQATKTQVGMRVVVAKQRLVGAAKANLRLNDDEAVAEATRVWKEAGLGDLRKEDEVPVETVADLLSAFVERGGERDDPPAPPAAPDPAPEPQGSPEGSVADEGEPDGEPGEMFQETGVGSPAAVDPAAVVKSMGKPDVIKALGRRHLATTGNLSELRARLVEAITNPETLEEETARLLERAADPEATAEERASITTRLEEIEEAETDPAPAQ